MMITRVYHPSHPKHELELKHHEKKYYTCHRCKKEGSGLRYRCDKCDFDLHQYCMFNAQITNSKDSLLKTTIQSDIAMAITRVNHPSHPEHELELELGLKHHKKQNYTCDVCKKEGSGLRYRCGKCDFDLHQYCMFNAQITNSKDSLLKTTIRSDIAMAITRVNHPSHPEHELELKHHKKQNYTCDVCKKEGSGLRYRCGKCDFDLHQYCMFNAQITNSKDSLLKTTIRSDICYFDLHEDCMLNPQITNSKNSLVKSTIKGDMAAEDHRSHPQHELKPEHYMFNAQTTSHEFSHGSTFRFFTKPPINKALGNNKVSLQRRSNSSGGRGRKYWKILQIVLQTVAAILLGDPTVILTSVAINLITNLL